jgi:hypothetical protein
MRLARRQAYDAIGALALAARRTAVEPERVRLPLRTLAGLLAQCHVLLAAVGHPALAELPAGGARPQPGGTCLAGARDRDRPHSAQPSGRRAAADLAGPPQAQPTADFNQWLLRRLSLAELAACRVAQVNHELARAARALRRRP